MWLWEETNAEEVVSSNTSTGNNKVNPSHLVVGIVVTIEKTKNKHIRDRQWVSNVFHFPPMATDRRVNLSTQIKKYLLKKG